MLWLHAMSLLLGRHLAATSNAIAAASCTCWSVACMSAVNLCTTCMVSSSTSVQWHDVNSSQSLAAICQCCTRAARACIRKMGSIWPARLLQPGMLLPHAMIKGAQPVNDGDATRAADTWVVRLPHLVLCRKLGVNDRLPKHGVEGPQSLSQNGWIRAVQQSHQLSRLQSTKSPVKHKLAAALQAWMTEVARPPPLCAPACLQSSPPQNLNAQPQACGSPTACCTGPGSCAETARKLHQGSPTRSDCARRSAVLGRASAWHRRTPSRRVSSAGQAPPTSRASQGTSPWLCTRGCQVEAGRLPRWARQPRASSCAWLPEAAPCQPGHNTQEGCRHARPAGTWV